MHDTQLPASQILPAPQLCLPRGTPVSSHTAPLELQRKIWIVQCSGTLQSWPSTHRLHIPALQVPVPLQPVASLAFDTICSPSLQLKTWQGLLSLGGSSLSS
jgi:hypothetical protein